MPLGSEPFSQTCAPWQLPVLPAHAARLTNSATARQPPVPVARVLQGAPADDGASAAVWEEWDAVAQQGGEEVVLQLKERLGSGGSSDVYSLSSCSGSGSHSTEDCTVKLARFCTEHVLASFEAERRSLAALADGPSSCDALAVAAEALRQQ